MPVLARAVIALGLVPVLAAHASADVIKCDASDGQSSIEIAVDFSETRDEGAIEGVRVLTPEFRLSTYPKDSERPPETLAFSDVLFDRIELGLESANTGPMTLVVNIVRAAVYAPDDEPESDVVVAGVARIGSGRTVTLICTGW
ncbi:hypothetical protein [Pelagibacterium limicola]|uniref:hypothetical protein n=1 Tax=Pelagibacterium limicola TaxID=2791022 RepID=UPI0018AFFAB1|nr:hypothetical protein [Pelagibacterium limicola]